jgi:thioredoxin 1
VFTRLAALVRAAPLTRFAALALIAAFSLIVVGCGDEGEAGAEGGQTSAGDIASDTVAAGGQALPRLVDLGADKCVPCKMMAPILEELRETYAGRLDVQFIDVWKDPAPGREYGVKVIPTQIFFDEQGNELFRHQGFMSREDILAKWAELGYEFES